MRCECCGEIITKKDGLFKETLSIVEQERLVKLNIHTNNCRNCQTDILLLTALQKTY